MISNIISSLGEDTILIIASVASYVLGIFSKIFTASAIDDIKQKKERKKTLNKYKKIEKKYPELISEIRNDLIEGQELSPRVFMIKSSKTTSNNGVKLEYHTDKYKNLSEIVLSLEEFGVVSKSENYTFKLNEDFSEYLIKTG